METDFGKWVHVRSNGSLDEGLGLGLGLGALGAAAGAAALPWLKKKYQNWRDDPQRFWKQPSNEAEAARMLDQSDVITKFAESLGITALDNVKEALVKIAIARLYGPKFALVDESSLAIVWNELQKPASGRKGPTIAQQHGITRPWAIIEKVPGARPGMHWGFTKGAMAFDKKTQRLAQRPDQAAAREIPRPEVGDPAVSPPTGSRTTPLKPFENKRLQYIFKGVSDIMTSIGLTPPATVDDPEDVWALVKKLLRSSKVRKKMLRAELFDYLDQLKSLM